MHLVDHPAERDDGFADDDGKPVDDLGITHAVATIETTGGATRMTVRSVFDTTEQLEKMIQMGMEEGMREALGQIDAILADVSA